MWLEAVFFHMFSSQMTFFSLRRHSTALSWRWILCTCTRHAFDRWYEFLSSNYKSSIALSDVFNNKIKVFKYILSCTILRVIIYQTDYFKLSGLIMEYLCTDLLFELSFCDYRGLSAKIRRQNNSGIHFGDNLMDLFIKFGSGTLLWRVLVLCAKNKYMKL